LNRFCDPTTWITLTCWLIASIGLGHVPAQAQTPTGTIAYVRAGGTSGDQIRLIEPDGSNDRELWTVPVTDPRNIFEILSLSWRPDATELAFSSDHEHDCSIFASDLYTVSPSGSNFRRVSNGPACDDLADFEQGAVTVTIRNFTSSPDTNFFVYVQGAPGIIGLIIPHNDLATVTFPEVADFGAVEQEVVVIQAATRWEVAFVDVEPGQTVTASPDPAPAFGGGISEYGAWGPTWRSDGSRIGFARSATSCLSAYSVEADNTPIGTKGDPVLTTDDIAPCSMAWAPTSAQADQVLFLAFPNLGLEGATFYLATEGDSGSSGEKLFSTGAGTLLLWYDWVPDGKSFLFVRTTKFVNPSFVESNIFEYDFATGDITQISELSDEVVRSFSVSPDGQQIVFERAAALDSATSELWIMEREGSDMRLLVEEGRIPNWSTKEPSEPPPDPPQGLQLFLPGMRR
jgi:WD40 repeat protein